MAEVRRRFVSYDVLGDERGPVPGWLSYTYTNPLNGAPTLTLEMPEDSPNAAWLDDWHEIRFERMANDQSGFVQDHNACMYLVGEDEDRRNPTKPRSLRYRGIATLLRGAPIEQLDDANAPPDPALGPVRPVREFKSCTPGRVMKRLIDSAQALGWCPGFGYTFGVFNDSAGVPWPVTLTFDAPVEYDPFQVLEKLTGEGYVDWRMYGRNLLMYVADTVMRRDLTITDPPTELRYGMGVKTAPLTRSFDDLATDVIGVAEDGIVLTDNNPDLELPAGVGRLWRRATISGTSDSTAASYAVAAALRGGANTREQRVREMDYTWEASLVSSGEKIRALQPGVDFEPGDVLDVDNRVLGDGEIGRAPMRVLEFMVTEGRSRPQSGFITLNDRQETRVDRMTRNLSRLTAGTAHGFLGEVVKPLMDTRRPDPPALPVPTGVVYLDRAGESKAAWSVLVTANETTTPAGGTAAPIKIDRVHLWVRVGSGVHQRVRSSEWAGSPVTIDLLDYPVGTSTYFRAQSESHDGFLSDLGPPTGAQTVAADEEAVEGATQVHDADFRSATIRAARTADAGAGFSFAATSGQYRGRFTSNTPVLGLGVAHTPTAGRRQVTAGEEYVVSAKAKRIGGTSVSARGQVRWYDSTGGTISTTQAFSTATTTGDAVYEGTVTAPAGAVTAAVRLSGQVFTGSPTLEMWEPRLDRRTAETRLQDGAVSMRTIQADSISSDKVQTSAITTPKLANGSVETLKIASGVDIDGTITTASGLTLGGISNDDIDFPDGATIGDSGSSGLQVSVGAGNFHVFGNITASGSITPGVSTRDRKVGIKPITVEQAKALLTVEPVTFKYREDAQREAGKRVIPAREVVDRSTGEKQWIKERVVPGRVDKTRHAGMIAEDVEAAGLEEILTRNPDGSLYGIQYSQTAPYVLRLVQDLYEQIAEIRGSAP